MLVFEAWAKPLLFAHLVAAVIALAGAIHCLVRLILLHRLQFPTMVPIRLHARTLAIAYLGAFGLGAMVYPTFRVRVRAEWLDSAHPFVVSLFEIKEHTALLALPAAGLAWYVARSMDFRQADDRRHLPALYGALLCVVAALGYDAWCGWYVASLRSI